MRTPSEHIKLLQRRVDFLKSREHQNSYDLAEIGSLEWVLANLPSKREWVGLTDEELDVTIVEELGLEFDEFEMMNFAKAIEAKLKEKNT